MRERDDGPSVQLCSTGRFDAIVTIAIVHHLLRNIHVYVDLQTQVKENKPKSALGTGKTKLVST